MTGRDINIRVNVVHVRRARENQALHSHGNFCDLATHLDLKELHGFAPFLNPQHLSLHHNKHIHHLIHELHLRCLQSAGWSAPVSA